MISLDDDTIDLIKDFTNCIQSTDISIPRIKCEGNESHNSQYEAMLIRGVMDYVLGNPDVEKLANLKSDYPYCWDASFSRKQAVALDGDDELENNFFSKSLYEPYFDIPKSKNEQPDPDWPNYFISKMNFYR